MAKRQTSAGGAKSLGQIAVLKQQVEELTQALQQERADAENIRRRHDAEMSQLKQFVTADVVQHLLPVIDNFERAIKHVPKDLADHDYVKGVQGIVKQFEKTLADMGVERIKTVGEVFNPHYHEAISLEDESSDGHQTDEVVSEELQPGFRIGDNVIRHAMVRVKRG